MSFSTLVSSGYMPRSRIAGSYDGFIPSFLRNLHAIFHSGCFQFTFLPTVHEGSFPSSAFIVCRHFDGNHSDWCKVIFHCSFDLHFSIMSDIEHLFMCLLAICMSSLEKCLFRSLSHFRIGLLLSCMSCVYNLEINPLSVVSFAIIFSHSEFCLFTLFIVSVAMQKLLSLIRSTCLLLFLFPLL